MKREIVQMGKKVLRKEAQYIEPSEITSDTIQNIITDMHESLATQNDGVAIAAPQIGESYQIFTVAPFLFDEPEKEHLVYINPVIKERSKKEKWMHEGCLSCRWKVGEVERSLETVVEAYDEHGQKFTVHATGLLAHIHQHEIDHLYGTLFIDKARKLRDMTQKEIDEVLEGK
ncbi:MAG: peptide deformylase [Candidatus Pacebacteria bacterium]|nr:peptide deformylase [Candidatus Paceibacterota bacterium]